MLAPATGACVEIMAVVGLAGATETGSVDDLEALAVRWLRGWLSLENDG